MLLDMPDEFAFGVVWQLSNGLDRGTDRAPAAG